MAEIKKISTELQLLDKFLDTSGDAGTSGQVLSSTGSGVNWVSGGSLPGGPYLPLAGGTMTGQLTFPYGFLGDYIYHTGDSDTYFGFSGNDTFSLATGGSNRLHINSSGNVGIGTTSPNKKLHVKDGDIRIESTFPRLYLTDTDNDSDYSILNANGNFRVYDDTNSAYRMAIDSTGNVGIGTTTPTAPLHIEGGTNSEVLKIEADSNPFVRWVENGTDVGFLQFLGDNAYLSNMSNGSLFFRTNNTDKMTITSSGNVGIGTTNPSMKMHIEHGDQDGLRFRTATTFETFIDFADTNDNDAGSIRYDHNVNSLSFRVNASEKMRIDLDGNVGIGVVNPETSRLLVRGSTNDSTSLIFQAANLAGATRYTIRPDGDNKWYKSDNSLSMILTSAGNVGIGTTSPGYKLDVESSTTPLHLNRTGGATALIGLDINGTTRGLLGATTTAAFVSYSTAAAPLVTVANTGGIQFNTYSAGTLVSDASGNITVSSGGGAGGPYVTIATTQTVTGAKTFTGDVEMHSQEPSGASIARKGFVGISSGNNAQKFKILTNNNTGDGYARFKIDRAYDYGNNDQMVQEAIYQRRNTIKNFKFRYDGDTSTTDDVYLEVYELSSGYIEIWCCVDDYAQVSIDIIAGNQCTIISSPSAGTPTGTLIHSSNPDTETPNWDSYQGDGYFAGNVGIGTTSPQGNLHVVGATGGQGRIYVSDKDNGESATDSLLITQSATNSFIYNRDSGDLRLGSNDQSSMMTIKSTGNVGIGTTSPNEKLSVDGNIESLDTFVLNYADNGIKWQQLFDGGNAWNLRHYNGTAWSSSAITVKTNNNVGIGTTSPSQKLQVNGIGEFAGALRITETGTSQNILIGNQDSGGTNTPAMINGVNGILRFGKGNSWSGEGGTFTEAMRVDPSGNIGIGTTSPSQKLEVAGKLLVDNGDLGSVAGDAIYHAEITGTRHHLDFKEVRTANGSDWPNTTYKLQMRVDSTNHQSIDFVSDANAQEHIDIYTNNQVFNTRFDANGDVGIGTDSPATKLHVNSSSTVSYIHLTNSTTGGTGSDGVDFGVNGSDVYLWNRENSSTIFGTNGAERMRIGNTGNVGIGTTSPSYKLDVDGDGRINGITFVASGATRSISTHSSAGLLQLNGGTNSSNGAFINIAGDGYATGDYIEYIGSRHYFTGNVGIGTTSPTEKLEVDGNVKADSFIKDGGTSSQYLMADGTTSTGNSSGVTSIASSTEDGKEGIEVTNGSSAAVTVGLDLDLIDENVSSMTHVVGVDGDDKNIKTEKSQFFAYYEQFIGDVEGDGTATSFTVTHDLGTRYIIQIVDIESTSSTYLQEVYPKIVRTSATAVTISFNTAPANGHNYTVYMTKINPRQI